MDTGVLLPELEAFAGLETALADALKLCGDGLWRLSQAEVLDLVRRTHVLTARVESLTVGLVREVETRGIAGSLGATSTQALLIESLAAPMPGADSERDPRSLGVRRADAALEVCRRVLRFGDLPRQRGQRPHVHVTVNAQDLQGRDRVRFDSDR